VTPGRRANGALACAAAGLALVLSGGTARAGCIPVYGQIELVPGLSGPSSLAAADLNGDGRADLVAVVDGRLAVFLNDGTGRFQPPVALATGAGPFTLGDFDGDGHVDIAFANQTAYVVQVFSGNGDGTFRPPRTLAVPSPAYLLDVAAGDFDGDGATDLAVMLDQFTIGVHLQRQGALSESPVLSSGPPGYQLLALDFNRDGRTDLLKYDAQFGGSTLYSLVSEGDGTFSWSDSGISAGGYHLQYELAVGDFDGDGYPDVAVVNSGNGYPATLHLFRNGSGGFVESAVLTLERRYGGVRVADFDGDGRPEIAVTLNDPVYGPELLVYRSPDASRLFLASRQEFPNTAPQDLYPPSEIVADFEGDGLRDLILWRPADAAFTPLLMRGSCPAVPPPPLLKGWPTPVVSRRHP